MPTRQRDLFPMPCFDEDLPGLSPESDSDEEVRRCQPRHSVSRRRRAGRRLCARARAACDALDVVSSIVPTFATWLTGVVARGAPVDNFAAGAAGAPPVTPVTAKKLAVPALASVGMSARAVINTERMVGGGARLLSLAC